MLGAFATIEKRTQTKDVIQMQHQITLEGGAHLIILRCETSKKSVVYSAFASDGAHVNGAWDSESFLRDLFGLLLVLLCMMPATTLPD
jgi:hypothetical protein